MAKANKDENKSTFNTFITLGANNHTDVTREKGKIIKVKQL